MARRGPKKLRERAIPREPPGADGRRLRLLGTHEDGHALDASSPTHDPFFYRLRRTLARPSPLTLQVVLINSSAEHFYTIEPLNVWIM